MRKKLRFQTRQQGMNKWNEESMGAAELARIELGAHTLPAHWVYYTHGLQRGDMGSQNTNIPTTQNIPSKLHQLQEKIFYIFWSIWTIFQDCSLTAVQI